MSTNKKKLVDFVRNETRRQLRESKRRVPMMMTGRVEHFLREEAKQLLERFHDRVDREGVELTQQESEAARVAVEVLLQRLDGLLGTKPQQLVDESVPNEVLTQADKPQSQKAANGSAGSPERRARTQQKSWDRYLGRTSKKS